jgi:hypothetical protein
MSEEVMISTDHGYDNFCIKAFIITMMNNAQSVVSTRKLLYSMTYVNDRTGNVSKEPSWVQPFIINATIPETIDSDIKINFNREYADGLYKNGKLNWTWPISSAQNGIDFSTGLYKRAYAAADWKKVAACTISHMRLWQHCIDINEPILILEHDAIFHSRFKYHKIAMCGHYDKSDGRIGEWSGGICALNDPIGSTRKGRLYHQKVVGDGQGGLRSVPYIDDPHEDPLPTGLPGNSAYIIKPWAAKKLLDKTLEVGLWPNDALMCKQFFPWLQIYYPYFTSVQGTPSTTTK